jgi:putative peptidoglycan binding protein
MGRRLTERTQERNQKLTSYVLLIKELNKEVGPRSNLSSTIMKTFLLLVCLFTSALAQVAPAAQAEDQDQAKKPNKQRQPPPKRTAIAPMPRIQRSATVPQQMPSNRAPHFNPVRPNQPPKVSSFVDRDQARVNRVNRNPDMMPRIRPNPSVVTPPQTTTTVQSNINAQNRFGRDDRNRTNRNWQNQISNNNSWEDARRRHHRDRHDRDWWRSRFSRFALFGSGYYFWDNGYWYPAYGYDPGYDTYSYNEPIYGYNDLDPSQVISSVQTQLQRLGYYHYAVDGQMGPATRAAIATYQRDNGLPMTSAIDEPTLQSLGLG